MKNLFMLLTLFLFYGCSSSESDIVETAIEEETATVVTPPEPTNPEYGTPLSDPYCVEEPSPQSTFLKLLNLVQDVADGTGGKQIETLEENSEECGYIPQMEEPTFCLTAATDTGDSRYRYMTCDGIKQKTDVDFPYDVTQESLAVIDLLAVIDTKLTDEDREGLSSEEFVQRELDVANKIFSDSGVYIHLRLSGVQYVEVASGDLRRQYSVFFNARQEFENLNQWQEETNADIAFLFKKREENPIACGVAGLDATQGINKTRGITQCFQNSVFQENSVTRYYQRAHETFTHEIGHILGLQHEESDASGVGLLEHSYGYNVTGYKPDIENYEGTWSGYGTIMSYADLPTGRFSSTQQRFEIPENGKSVKLGTTGGCLCLEPIENQPSPTEAVDHLNRVRYLMSQLSEKNHSLDFSAVSSPFESPDICLF